MRINIDLTDDAVVNLNVLAATEKRDRKSYIQEVLEIHARKEYAKLLTRMTEKVKMNTKNKRV